MPDPLSFEYDTSLPLPLTDLVAPQVDEAGRRIREVSFPSHLEGPGGGTVEATLIQPPESMTGPHAAICWVHWFEPHAHSSNRSQFREEALTLAAEGVVSLLVDAFWSMTPAQWASNPRYVWTSEVEHDRQLSINQTIALRRSLDVLLAEDAVDPKRVAFVGHDFGAMYGALVAGADDRVAHYTLMAGTCTFSDWFLYGQGQSYDKETRDAYIKAMAPLAPSVHIAQAAPAELYFQFAHHDLYVPERMAQIFYNAASEPKDIAWYDASHDMDDAQKNSQADRLAMLRKKLALQPAG